LRPLAVALDEHLLQVLGGAGVLRQLGPAAVQRPHPVAPFGPARADGPGEVLPGDVRDHLGDGLPLPLRGAVVADEPGADAAPLVLPLAAMALPTPLPRPGDVAEQSVHLLRGGVD